MKTFALFAGFLLLAATVGDELPALELKDASDAPHVLDASIRRIYFTGDRGSGGVMKDAAPVQAQLDAQHAIVIADISEAPGFVKFMIRSSLKDRGYLSWVDAGGVTKSLFPVRTGQVTVLDLEQRRIRAIRYAADVAAVKQELAHELK